MVGKSLLSLVLSLSILLAVQPFDASTASARGEERYNLDNLPPQDQNGNFTLDEDDEWDIIGQGILEGNITMCGQSMLIISDANITINGTIWAKDESEIIIKESIVTVEVPSHEPVLIEKQYDDPNGFLLIEEKASLKIGDSHISLHRHDFHEFGEIIPNGTMIPQEVMVIFGKFFVKDSYIDTSGSITYGTIKQSIYRGIVLHMNCEIHISGSTLTSGMVFYVNSHGYIESSKIRSISMQKNTKGIDVVISNSTVTHTVTVDKVSEVNFENCELKSILIVKYEGKSVLLNTTMQGLRLSGNGTVIMDKSAFSIEPTYPDWNHAEDNSTLKLLNSSFIKKLYLSENSSISLIDSSMNHTILNDRAVASLKNSVIDNLSASENSTVWLKRSEIGKYCLSDNASICNITMLAVNTKLNQQPLQVPVILKDPSGKILASQDTDEEGKAEFTLIRDMISINKTTMEMTFSPLILYCFVGADYENLHKEKGMDIDDDYLDVGLEFEDFTAPVISDVSFEIDPYLNTNEQVLVSVHVEDEDTNLARVELRYSKDGGLTWENITMHGTGQNIYENSIPGQSDGTKVRFYIVAEDKCGNTAESEYYAYTVGEGVVLINNMIVITALVLVFAALIWVIIKVLWDKKKLGKYIHRDE